MQVRCDQVLILAFMGQRTLKKGLKMWFDESRSGALIITITMNILLLLVVVICICICMCIYIYIYGASQRGDQAVAI